MTDFAGMLSRLATHRGLDVSTLAQAADIPDTELTAVYEGTLPSEVLLRRLAPVFGLHASDLFLIAGLRPPDDLAPAGRGVCGGVETLVYDVVYAPPVGRHLHELLRTMVGQADTRPTEKLVYERWFIPSFGALLMRLFGNRNMNQGDAVKVLFMLADFGAWSAATLTMVGKGRKEVSDELVAASSVVLGIPAGDLAALAGLPLPEQNTPEHPRAAEARELIWAARGISGPQMEQLNKQSHILRHEYEDVLSPALVCNCSLLRDTEN